MLSDEYIDSILDPMQDGMDCWLGHMFALELKQYITDLRNRIKELESDLDGYLHGTL